MKIFIASILAVAPIFCSASEPQCGPTEKIVKILRTDFSELPILKAMTDDEKMMTLWYNKEESSYTILESERRGVSCIISTGKNLKPYIAEQSVSR